jgi:carbon-monoxide dehydrogenase medium subunit
MKPAKFDYARPKTLEQAVALLAANRDDVRIIAGGQSLMPMLAFRLAAPRLLVDIGRLPELKSLVVSDDGVALGALVRWCDIERHKGLADAHPLLSEAIRHVAHYQIRNRGTVGGSLAHADPAAEMPGVALVCDAMIDAISSQGSRSIVAADFLTGPLTTALRSDEIVVRVRLPAWPSGRRWAFEEFARRKGDFALAGVALHYDCATDGTAAESHIVGIGISDTPVRLRAAEEVLRDRIVDDRTVAEAAAVAADGVQINEDIHAPADYRSALLGILLERALRRAAGLAKQ